MSQRKRRRRRRGRGGGKSGGGAQQGQQPASAATNPSQDQSSTRRRRKRRRGKGPRSPKSSEDLVRALPTERPEQLTAPPDGTVLEELIGELQSTWGVPQYPQEYRLLIKVGETRERSSPRSEPTVEEPVAPERQDGTVVREKAPSPQELSGAPDPGSRPSKPRSGRRRRKRRRRGGGGSEG